VIVILYYIIHVMSRGKGVGTLLHQWNVNSSKVSILNIFFVIFFLLSLSILLNPCSVSYFLQASTLFYCLDCELPVSSLSALSHVRIDMTINICWKWCITLPV